MFFFFAIDYDWTISFIRGTRKTIPLFVDIFFKDILLQKFVSLNVELKTTVENNWIEHRRDCTV